MKLIPTATAPARAERRRLAPVALRALRAPGALLVVAMAGLWGTLRLAVHGALPPLASSLAAALIDARRGLLRRHGFWLVVLLASLELPQLGSFGLIDPWETHYAEVAREMLARRDPISMW